MKFLITAMVLVSPWIANSRPVANEFVEQVSQPIDDSMKVDKKICSGSKSYPVHLSFDDGPDPKITPQVLDILRKAGIKATFLISTDSLLKGKPEEIQARKMLIERMKSEGHTIGSHSYAHIEHANSELTSRKTMLENLNKSFREMDKLNLPKPRPFRFPYGSGWVYDSAKANQDLAHGAMTAIKREGYYPFHWDIDTNDWSKIKRKALPVSALEQICSSKGGVILMHDVHKWTADNLAVLIESIRQSGHTFASEAEIIDYSKNKASRPLVSLADQLGGTQGCEYRGGHLDRAGSKCNTNNTSQSGNKKGIQ
ncbi:polysaccharide deacetylase family protein [Bdellovibrio sp. HCB274]|uniref:polysaccharide deacetylase family protein n=1 Tax=Bdellovibrio sp. HCB274 TaxID=3394361 RepID=UPI0039B6179C